MKKSIQLLLDEYRRISRREERYNMMYYDHIDNEDMSKQDILDLWDDVMAEQVDIKNTLIALIESGYKQ